MGPAAVASASVTRTSSSRTRPKPHPERRCHLRVQTEDLIVLSPRFAGRVLDISTSGLRIVTTTRLTPGEQLTFRLVGEHRSVASAVVQWCRLDSVFETRAGEILSLYQIGMSLLHEPHRLPPTVEPS